jgi:hypothetical protein
VGFGGWFDFGGVFLVGDSVALLGFWGVDGNGSSFWKERNVGSPYTSNKRNTTIQTDTHNKTHLGLEDGLAVGEHQKRHLAERRHGFISIGREAADGCRRSNLKVGLEALVVQHVAHARAVVADGHVKQRWLADLHCGRRRRRGGCCCGCAHGRRALAPRGSGTAAVARHATLKRTLHCTLHFWMAIQLCGGAAGWRVGLGGKEERF